MDEKIIDVGVTQEDIDEELLSFLEHLILERTLQEDEFTSQTIRQRYPKLAKSQIRRLLEDAEKDGVIERVLIGTKQKVFQKCVVYKRISELPKK